MTMVVELSQGHVWTHVENDVFGAKRLLYLGDLKISIPEDDGRSNKNSKEGYFQNWQQWPLFNDESLWGNMIHVRKYR